MSARSLLNIYTVTRSFRPLSLRIRLGTRAHQGNKLLGCSHTKNTQISSRQIDECRTYSCSSRTHLDLFVILNTVWIGVATIISGVVLKMMIQNTGEK